MLYKVKRLAVNFLKFRKAFVNYSFRKFKFAEIFLLWLREKLTRSQFLILSGIMVGFTAGFAGVLLKVLVHRVQTFVNTGIPFEERIFAFALFPALGIFLTAVVVKYFFGGKNDRVFSGLLVDISQRRSKIRSSKMYSQILQSAITVGFGGSVGVETPNAITGSAIGSNYAQRYRLGFKERTLLLASGAAAGIASLFDAPIAGVMFAYEVLLMGIVFTDLIPLVIAAICGSLVSTILVDDQALFHFLESEGFYYKNTFYYILLGLVTGFYARYYLVVGTRINRYFKRYEKRTLRGALLGGIGVSLLCVVFPPLYGEGYLNINTLHHGDIDYILHESLFRYFGVSSLTIIIFLGLAVVMKAVATGLTLHSGGSGGNFAPSLVSGGMLGYLFGYVLQTIGVTDIPTTNFMLVGMAGVMAGVWYAPMTGIFLIAEISSGYQLLVPLMIVAVMSFVINRFFSQVNPNYSDLADKGEIFTTRQDQNLLVHIALKDCLNPLTLKVDINESLQQVLNKVRSSNQNTIAVVNNENKYLGIIDREHLRPYLVNPSEAEGVGVNQLLSSSSFEIKHEDSVMKVIKMFDEADVWQLPLIDAERKFEGFVSRSAILKNYRSLLREFSDV